MQNFFRGCILFFITGIFFSSCKNETPENAVSACDSSAFLGYTVSYNPYIEVDWKNWSRCLSQHHDHVDLYEDRISAYDKAGYNAIVPLQYCGKLSLAPAKKKRNWPVYKFFNNYKSDKEFLSGYKNLKFFIPSMEEVGCEHITSSFLTEYIEFREPKYSGEHKPWQYSTTQECIDLINKYGGIPIIAHPKRYFSFYDSLHSFSNIEIYNAFYRDQYISAKNKEDDNNFFVNNWDLLLAKNGGKIWGYAVNDWFGPYNQKIKKSDPHTYDSGKTLVLLENMSPVNYRNSLVKGSFFAIKDIGLDKLKFPVIDSIKQLSPSKIRIYTKPGNRVRWIYKHEMMYSGIEIDLVNNVPPQINYIRAEVANPNGTVYVQPFSLKKITCQ